MHRRIDTALRRIRQELGNVLDRATVQQICRQFGYSYRAGAFIPLPPFTGSCFPVLCGNTALEHTSISPRSPRRRSPTRPTIRRERGSLSPSTKPSRGLIKAFIPRNVQRSMAWASHLPDRRFVIRHARHSRASVPLRPIRSPGSRMRIPRCQDSCPVSREYRSSPCRSLAAGKQ